MAITIPHVFVAGTRIESAPVNQNFAAMSNALDANGDTLLGDLAVGAGKTIDGLDISTVPQTGGTFNPNSIVFTNVILGAATTSGIRLDLESGTLAVREGDDSAYGPMLASVYNVPTGGSVNFNAGSAALTWDTTESTANLALSGSVDYKLGAQELVRCVNRTGTAIAKGKAVYIVGAHGNRPQIALADASDESTASTTLGITAESIADTAEGFVCISGMLRGLNTNSLTEGQIVWLSETAGELTSTRPTQPAHGVFMGLCVRQQPGTSGILYISVVNGLELEELHDVLITTPSANQILKRNSGNTLWENSSGAALTKTDDTNVTLTLGGSASTALVNAASLTLGWTGTLAASRLNANVVQGITNDTNVTGSISAQTLTLGWTGTLASTRLNSNVVQAITNDTNVTGSISTQTLTLGWTGQLAVGRGGTGASTLTGYVKGSGTAALTASSTIPNTDITGLGTLSTQNASSVSISGGSITGITDLAIADGGTGASTAQGAMNALAGATTSGQYLRGNGTNVVMSAIQAGDVPTLNQNTTGTAAGLSATLAVSSGGTGQTSYTDGQLLIGNTATTSLSKATLTAGSGVTITNGNGSITIAATGSGGTVTSVGATSPVASSGGTTPTISLNSAYGDTLNPYGSKTANYVLAAPDGGAGTPSFRALVAADIPTLNQNTTGTAAGLSSTLAVASGGTGQTTYTDGQLLIGNSTGNTLTKATLTAGSGISITNGGGSITIAATGGGGGGGTVTSVSGTGTVNGVSLSGTVTSTGSLTLSGTVDSMSALAGSASAPSIAASGDTDTGIFFPAANTIAVTTGGTERLRVNSAGRLLLNLTTDNMGLPLNVLRGAGIIQFSDAVSSELYLRRSRNTEASPVALATNDVIGNIIWQGYGGTNYRTLATINTTITTYTSDTDMTSALRFYTTNAGTVNSERFRIAGNGDVAIGSGAKLLLDSVFAGGDTYLTESSANNLSIFTGGTERLRVTSGGDLAIGATERIYLDGVAGTGDTYLTESAANTISVFTGGTERLQFTSGTAVVIGSGEGTATVAAQTFRGAAAAGTNIAGANLTIEPSNGTGTGGSGAIIFRTAPATTSGTTANTLADRVRITNTGNVAIGATARLYLDSAAATGDTYLSESSANVMSFTAGGTEGFRVEASQATLPTGGSLGWIRGGTSTGPFFQEALGALRLYTDGAEHFVAFNGTSKRFSLNSAQFEVGPGATGSSDIRFKVLGSSGAAGTVVIGHNDASATPGTQKMTLRGANGSGTNIAGASLFLAAGNGTGTGGSGAIVFETASTGSSGTTANTLTERVRIDRDGNVGINVSTFGTSAAGVLGLKNGTEPTTGPADTVQVYSVDLSAGNTIPAIYTEGTGVTTAGITNTTVTTKIAIKVNGTVYYLLATTNAT